jgi:hypothetical protein
VSELPRPRTPDEEIVQADSAQVASLFTDAGRVERIKNELWAGFHALADLGPAAVVFGSARTPASDPLYADSVDDSPRQGSPS